MGKLVGAITKERIYVKGAKKNVLTSVITDFKCQSRNCVTMLKPLLEICTSHLKSVSSSPSYSVSNLASSQCLCGGST